MYEILPLDESLKERFIRNPSTLALRERAREHKMKTLHDRAMEMAAAGKTTLDEVVRERRKD